MERPPFDGEPPAADLAGMLRDLEMSGFDGPASMEIEFTNYEWPSWDECVDAARRGKAWWDGL